MYSDGKPCGKSTPCAANQGTMITVEDLFFNVPTRKRVLKSPTEEYNRIADVVSKYRNVSNIKKKLLYKIDSPLLIQS